MQKAGRIKTPGPVGQVGRVGQVARAARVAGALTLLVALTYVVSGFSRTIEDVVSGFSRTVIAQTQPPQEPRFQSSVEVTSLDISVVDDRGKPISGLTPADFTVRVDGNPRRVVTAEWVPLTAPASDEPVAPPPDGYSTNEGATGGRLIVMAIDQPNIRFGGAMAIQRAAQAFIDRLTPSDRVAVAGFGIGAPATPFTSDRERTKQALSRMVGQKQVGRSIDVGHSIALVEAQAIDRGDRDILEQVQNRECLTAGNSPGAQEMCRNQVEIEARSYAFDVNRDADSTLQTLRDLFVALRTIDAPKTLILISEGFVLNDEALIVELGGMAAEARTSLYALKLDTELFEISDSRMPINPFADRQARAEGLELLAGAARGTLFTVTGTGQPLFERIESEISGYYLLGVESDPKDKDNKTHSVRIDVQRKGVIVRSRRHVLNTPTDRRVRAARSPRQAVATALGSPLLASALPLRVASFALQGPERDKVQLLIHADVGTDYPGSKVVSLGYMISDKTGRLVDSKAVDMRLLPVMPGVPSPLQFTSGASLPPGDYTIKLAAVEGERIGTVEHTIHAELPSSGNVRLSELMVGGPLESGQLLTPTIGYQINFGAVHGYVEAYGTSPEGVTMEYEVATGPEAPALLNADVPPHQVSDSRIIFTKVLQTQQLPPGRYVLRAILSSEGKSMKMLTRGFEIATPKVLLTSADGLGGETSVDAELFLPVDERVMTPAFELDTAVDETTIAPFRERVAASVKDAFNQGIEHLAAGDYSKAELSFKKAIDPEGDATAPLTYLAAAFAASGHDREAASAWQTALVDGTEFPQIYQWLGDALLRSHDFGEARSIFEEAVGKWPTDVRFTKPLAMLYGTFGKGREAVRTLERYLEAEQEDRDAYLYAVQWIYTVHSGGAVVHNRSEDVKRAREYADAYASARGPQLALVRQWVDYLENGKK
jgi:VWFA-related protein